MKDDKGMDDIKPGPQSRVKGGGGQNSGSAKVISAGNKRGPDKRQGSSMGVTTTNRFPGNMGHS